MSNAARVGDKHKCADSGEYPAADLKIQTGSPNIFINNKPAARVGDKLSCKVEKAPVIVEGSSTVFFNGKPAARLGDAIEKGGSIAEGSPNVIIGDGGCKISFGNNTKIKFGDNCKVRLSCGNHLHAAAFEAANTPSPITTTEALVNVDTSLSAEAESFGLDVTPVVGSAKSAVQAITGKDTITGESVDRKWELAGIAFGLLPFGKVAGKALKKCGKSILLSLSKKGLEEPVVTDLRLKNIVKELYKGKYSKKYKPVGTGSTADAIRHEIKEKEKVGEKFHSIKGQHNINALKRWQRWVKQNKIDVSESDKKAAQDMIDDLNDALGNDK